jgi:predicted small lipoprotein YifL
MTRRLALLLMLPALLLVAACGREGPLRLPEEPPAADSEADRP